MSAKAFLLQADKATAVAKPGNVFSILNRESVVLFPLKCFLFKTCQVKLAVADVF